MDEDELIAKPFATLKVSYTFNKMTDVFFICSTTVKFGWS